MRARRSVILVVGFNRPEMLRERIRELIDGNFENIRISIDCTSNGYVDEKILELAKSYSDLTWVFRFENLGAGRHVPFAVTEALEDFDNCVVIEDDVKISTQSLTVCLELLSEALPDQYFTIGFFGSVPFNRFTSCIFGKKNMWRVTEYFSAWGWGVQREAWSKYQSDLSGIDFEAALSNSSLWNGKSDFSKAIWLGRFRKSAMKPDRAWDFQMQFSSFANDKTHLLTVYRSADNLGFGDSRGSNTTGLRPRWYLGISNNGVTEPLISSKGLRVFVLSKIDAATWAGDSLSYTSNKIMRVLSKFQPKRVQNIWTR